MQQIIPIMQIISRATLIGWSLDDLAKAANVAVSTVYRAIDRGGCRSQTLEALGDALMLRERELQTHLQKLHPETQHGHGEAE